MFSKGSFVPIIDKLNMLDELNTLDVAVILYGGRETHPCPAL